jgi:hypothetical protein
MTIAVSIFLSSLIFACILMYALTRDRWNWRKIATRFLVVVGVIGLLACVAIALFTFQDQLLPVSVPKEYAGPRIGMTMAEVKYAKGIPDNVYGDPETEGTLPKFLKGSKPVLNVKEFKDDQKVEDYKEWSFKQDKSRIDVTFDKDRLIVIQCYSGDKLHRCPTIARISDGDTEQRILNRLGNPDSTELEGTAKIMYYQSKGAFFYLTRQEVYLLGINDEHYRRGNAGK